MKLSFATSSDNKVGEISQILGDEYQVKKLEADLPEIQSLDLHEIIQAKLEEAMKLYPDELIMVEDTSFEVDAMNGFPGTFVKFAEATAGDKGIYEMARGMQPEGEIRARAKVAIGLINNSNIDFFDGVVEGHLVEEKGEGWGFDKILIPDGYDQRLGTLGQEVKSQISHRAMATHALKKYLDSIA